MLIIDNYTDNSLTTVCLESTFDVSILHQVSLLAKIDPTAEYLCNLAPSRAGMLMDVEV